MASPHAAMVAPARRRVPTGPARRAGPVPVLVGVVAVGVLAGCGSAGSPGAAGHSAPAGTAATGLHQVQGRVGTLVLGDGYVPAAASPDVAAAYLTVVNTGDAPERLTAVRSELAGTVVPMTETTSGAVGGMAPLPQVVVPANGRFSFRPGAAHLMLEQPHPVPAAGDAVALTLTFTPGGSVTLALPVLPIGTAEPRTPTG